jgi:CRISPR/Cas system endoribonuclease Cas6 (RAMP superfamily)
MRIPNKPSGRRATPFYWWRRFRTHKNLPYKAPLINKIRNGDFEYSPFFEQAKWELHWMKEEQEEFIKNYQGKNYENDNLYEDIERRARKRYNKLYEDAIKDETDRMERLINGLSKYFKVKKDNIRNIIEEFDGTTEELYFSLQRGLAS